MSLAAFNEALRAAHSLADTPRSAKRAKASVKAHAKANAPSTRAQSAPRPKLRNGR